MLRQALRTSKANHISTEQAHRLNRIVRVDQAGELGADFIYAGQHAVFSITKPGLAPLIKHMWAQEVHHRNTFNETQITGRVRPSIFTPIWKTAAFSLGVGTALLGQEAAMACTEAVETVIGGHYNKQLRWLHHEFPDHMDETTDIGLLKKNIKQFRDDELEHLDTAVHHGAKRAVPYAILTETIKNGCRAAIWIAERA